MQAVTSHVAQATANEAEVVLGVVLALFHGEFPILTQLASQVGGTLSGSVGSGSSRGGMQLGLLHA